MQKLLENAVSSRQIIQSKWIKSSLYAILIPSLVMTISAQQAIQRLGEYIRIFIEPQSPGLNWENRWREYKLHHNYRGGLRGMGGIYYFLSLLPLYSISQSPKSWPLLLVIVPFLGWSLYLSFDLQAAISSRWKWTRWEKYLETVSERKAS